jgi:hypothetical protein
MRGGGNWIPFLFIMIGVFALVKGIEWGVHYIVHKIHERRHRHDGAANPD